jgi:hypothetical protein
MPAAAAAAGFMVDGKAPACPIALQLLLLANSVSAVAFIVPLGVAGAGAADGSAGFTGLANLQHFCAAAAAKAAAVTLFDCSVGYARVYKLQLRQACCMPKVCLGLLASVGRGVVSCGSLLVGGSARRCCTCSVATLRRVGRVYSLPLSVI